MSGRCVARVLGVGLCRDAARRTLPHVQQTLGQIVLSYWRRRVAHVTARINGRSVANDVVSSIDLLPSREATRGGRAQREAIFKSLSKLAAAPVTALRTLTRSGTHHVTHPARIRSQEGDSSTYASAETSFTLDAPCVMRHVPGHVNWRYVVACVAFCNVYSCHRPSIGTCYAMTQSRSA